MRRTDTENGAKFTVRGQRYIQVGSFYHEMVTGHVVRVLELETDCPECGTTFELTASLRQIETRMLTRRCERCREIHRGPVDVRLIERRKAKEKSKEREGKRRQIVARRAKRRKVAALSGARALARRAGAILTASESSPPQATAINAPAKLAAALSAPPQITSQADSLDDYLKAMALIG